MQQLHQSVATFAIQHFLPADTVISVISAHLTSIPCILALLLTGAPSIPDAQPDQHVQVSVKGPEPGYIATPIIMVQTALTFQQERESCTALMGSGGVYTAGALLGESTLIQCLTQAGVIFEVTKQWTDGV